MLCTAGRGSFLALSAAGHVGGPSVHYGASVSPGRAPWRALSGRSKSRDLASIRGIAFRRARANQAHGIPQMCVCVSPLLLFLKYHSNRQRVGSDGTTTALQAFPLVTATKSASACGFVSVRVRACAVIGSCSSRNQEHNLKKRGAL